MHNVGKIDRYLRFAAAVVIMILHFTGVMTGKTDRILSTVGIILVITSLRQCCPLYALLGLGTCGVDTDESEIKIETKKLKLKK